MDTLEEDTVRQRLRNIRIAESRGRAAAPPDASAHAASTRPANVA